jgi:glutathione peroxidase
MKSCLTCYALGVIAVSVAASFAAEKPVPELLNRKMKTLQGKEVDLSKYEGKVLLIVNVASKCGLTPQYEQLEELHEKYSQQGLAVIGFPCNQFGKQEPGTADEIEEFCKANYHVQFDLFEKIDVNGENASPIYKTLKAQAGALQKDGGGDIEWNFAKFLVGRDGKVIARFHPKVSPEAPEVLKSIETELAKPAAAAPQ